MKLKSIWGLLIAIIEIEINETLFCTRFEKKFEKKKEKCLPKKETPKKGGQFCIFQKVCALKMFLHSAPLENPLAGGCSPSGIMHKIM